MKKLTAEKCREFISVFKSLEKEGHLALTSGYHLQALEIALPILEQQERGEGDQADDCDRGDDEAFWDADYD